MNSFEIRIMTVTLSIKLDRILRGINRSPQHCVRNLIELGRGVSAQELTKLQYQALYQQFLSYCISADPSAIKNLFLNQFLHHH